MPYIVYEYTTNFGKKLMIGIITREFYTINFGFKVLGDNIKAFYKQG
jgi:hypothetical protein